MFMCTAINHINLSCRLSRLLYKYSGENVRVGDTEHLPNYTKQDTTHLCVSLSQLIIKYSSEADRDPRPETLLLKRSGSGCLYTAPVLVRFLLVFFPINRKYFVPKNETQIIITIVRCQSEMVLYRCM